MPLTGYADRSRVLTRQRCPRLGYFEYEVPTVGEVGGIRPNRLNMDLLVGSQFHRGAEQLLSGKGVEEAVLAALEGDTTQPGFWPLVKSQGLVLGDQEDAYYVYNEQAALVEALIRGYDKIALPKLLTRFEVLEVEREDVSKFYLPNFELTWGSRADGLLMEKDSLDLYVLSLKTAKEYSKRTAAGNLHDMQGLSEIRAIDQRLGQWNAVLGTFSDKSKLPLSGPYKSEFFGIQIPEWFIKRHIEGGSPHVLGVKMEYAIKGLRLESPKGSGRWQYSNALIRPWKMTDDLDSKPKRKTISSSFGSSYAIRYEFQDAMGGNHRLGKGWERINIWEDMGVKAWIDYVAENEIQDFAPGQALVDAFVLPEDIYRNDEDMERWEKRVLFQERRVALGREKITEADSKLEDVLDEYFPPHSNSCDYPSRCAFQEVCYGPKAYLHDPMSSGLFTIREPNHKTELKKENK